MAKASRRASALDASQTLPSSLRNVTPDDSVRYDFFIGDASAICAAGLATEAQLPGRPGCERRQRACYDADGSIVAIGGRYNGWRSRPGSTQIERLPSGRYRIQITVSDRERDLRERRGESTGHERASLNRAPHADSPAAFAAGECATVASVGWNVEVIDGFGLHLVTHPDGRVVARPGYICRHRGEGRTFVPAGDLRDGHGRVRHLRLVSAVAVPEMR